MATNENPDRDVLAMGMPNGDTYVGISDFPAGTIAENSRAFVSLGRYMILTGDHGSIESIKKVYEECTPEPNNAILSTTGAAIRPICKESELVMKAETGPLA